MLRKVVEKQLESARAEDASAWRRLRPEAAAQLRRELSEAEGVLAQLGFREAGEGVFVRDGPAPEATCRSLLDWLGDEKKQPSPQAAAADEEKQPSPPRSGRAEEVEAAFAGRCGYETLGELHFPVDDASAAVCVVFRTPRGMADAHLLYVTASAGPRELSFRLRREGGGEGEDEREALARAPLWPASLLLQLRAREPQRNELLDLAGPLRAQARGTEERFSAALVADDAILPRLSDVGGEVLAVMPLAREELAAAAEGQLHLWELLRAHEPALLVFDPQRGALRSKCACPVTEGESVALVAEGCGLEVAAGGAGLRVHASLRPWLGAASRLWLPRGAEVRVCAGGEAALVLRRGERTELVPGRGEMRVGAMGLLLESAGDMPASSAPQ
jgi:hypothetical protein